MAQSIHQVFELSRIDKLKELIKLKSVPSAFFECRDVIDYPVETILGVRSEALPIKLSPLFCSFANAKTNA